MIKHILMASAFVIASAGGVAAQSNLEKVGQMKTTGVMDFTFIEQGGAYADSV